VWYGKRMTENKLPEDTHLAYVISHEAWYWSALPGRQPEVGVMASAKGTGGGVAWEFYIVEYDFSGSNPIKLGMFNEAFAAFEQIPEFFSALVAEKISSLEEVVALLRRIGAVDETDRTAPYTERGPAASALDTATAVIRHHPAGIRDEDDARALAASVLKELRDWASEQGADR